MKDFKPGEVIAPEWMQKEPTRYTNYFKNIPVFEVKTNKGNESIKVAVGGKIPNKVNSSKQFELYKIDKNKDVTFDYFEHYNKTIKYI